MPNNPYPKTHMPSDRITTGPAADRQPAIPGGITWYDRSRAQAAERNKGRALVVPDDHSARYPSMRQYEVLAIPRPASDLRQGSFDSVRADHLTAHIASRVREGFRVSGNEAVSVLNHYVGTMKGLQLLDTSSQTKFETLSSQFAANPSEQSLNNVTQFLGTLTPEARND
jgi:hypothetical protein